MAKKQKVIIVGGGFGGIKAALLLERNPAFDVSLVSERDDFRYYPSLYRAATGGKLTASTIPLSEIFEDKNISIINDTIKSLDRSAKVVASADKKYHYDVLILALGVITNFFGIKGLKEYAYGIKTIDEAKRLRDHIHKQLVEDRKPDLNYVVIGGGPTGVELAGALPHYVKHIMEAHGLKKSRIHVDLVEAAPRLMPRMPKPYSRAIAKRLRKLGVKLYLGETVRSETVDGLEFSGGTLKSRTVVWTAGVTNHPFFAANEFNITDHGKVAVDEFLAAEDDIYVIGDNANTPYSGMAQTALHDAESVAANLERLARGAKPKPYQAAKPAYVTPAGTGWAALMWKGVHLYGWLGWVMRSAADFVAYHDLEPIWKAADHWLAEAGEEETCLICAGQAKDIPASQVI
ncbi:MAG TPA: FAD-dependent oxidoreductase [Candidatus Saccharimonadales bacterium]|nr:FAD-dependent oxidoreductase [Candidatus Saccharimonadales bacterium]